MKKPKVNVSDTGDLTEKDWKELELTGVVIKGDRIIRTMEFMNRVHRSARKEISAAARILFS